MDHLRQVRGIAPKTCEGLHLAASRILGWCDARFPKHLLAMSFNHQTRTLITSNLRMFLRYLRWSGLNNQDLARFVPMRLAIGWLTCDPGWRGQMSGARSMRSA
jgi:integrase/recombinase XerD